MPDRPANPDVASSSPIEAWIGTLRAQPGFEQCGTGPGQKDFRRAAIEGLARAGPSLIPRILELIHDPPADFPPPPSPFERGPQLAAASPSANVRVSAVADGGGIRQGLFEVLSKMKGPEAIDALYQLLDEPAQRRQAALALTSVRPLPPDAIARVLAKDDPSLRGSLLSKVPGLLPAATEQGREQLYRFTLGALDDADPFDRLQALAAIPSFGTRPEAVARVTPLLDGPDLGLQLGAIQALAAWGPSAAAALPALRQLSGRLRPPQELTVLEAFAAIDAAEAARSEPQLRKLFGDPHQLNEADRNRALLSLLRTPGKPAGAALVALLRAEKQSASRTTLMEAIDAEDPIEPAAVPELGAVVRGEKVGYSAPAARALTKCGRAGRVELMSCLDPKLSIHTEQWGPIRDALRAVAPGNADELVPELLARYAAAAPGMIRSVTMMALQASGPGAVPYLEGWVARDPSRREEALSLLRTMGSQQSVDAVERLGRRAP